MGVDNKTTKVELNVKKIIK